MTTFLERLCRFRTDRQDASVPTALKLTGAGAQHHPQMVIAALISGAIQKDYPFWLLIGDGVASGTKVLLIKVERIKAKIAYVIRCFGVYGPTESCCPGASIVSLTCNFNANLSVNGLTL
jgi:hypothetical protein